MFKKRKTKTYKEIAEELKEYDDYLERLRKLTPNPIMPSNTSILLFTIGNVKSDIRSSINVSTVVMTLGFIGLGIIISIGFATI